MCDEDITSTHSGVGTYEVHEAPGAITDPETGEVTNVTVPYAAFRPAVVVTASPIEVAPGVDEAVAVNASGEENTSRPQVDTDPEVVRAAAPNPNVHRVPPDELFKVIPTDLGANIYVRIDGRVLKYQVVVNPVEVMVYASPADVRQDLGTVFFYLLHEDHPDVQQW